MGALTPEEEAMVRSRSPLGGKYDNLVNRESAYEIISRRAESQAESPAESKRDEAPPVQAWEEKIQQEKAGSRGGMLGEILWGTKSREGMVQALAKQAARTVGSQIGRQILRGVLGGILGGSRRK